jgi:hypothetical protein
VTLCDHRQTCIGGREVDSVGSDARVPVGYVGSRTEWAGAGCSTADTGVTSVPREIVVEHRDGIRSHSWSRSTSRSVDKDTIVSGLCKYTVGQKSGLVLLWWTFMDGPSPLTASQDGVETRVALRRSSDETQG